MIKVELIYTKVCPHCPHAKEIFRELKKKYKFDYKEIDALSKEGQKLVQKFKIMSVPTIIIDGKVAFIGVPLKDKAEAAVKPAIAIKS